MKHTTEELLLADRVMAICGVLKQRQADELFPERTSDSFGEKRAWLKEKPDLDFLPQAMELLGVFATAIKAQQS